MELKGKYASAIVYTDLIEESAISQIIELCNQPMFNNATIRIMPDVHSGKGCVIGFTAVVKENKVVPNLVGVDIGCGVLTTVFTTEDPIDFEKLNAFIKEKIPSGFDVRTKAHPMLNKDTEQLIRDVSEIVDKEKVQRHIQSCGSLGGGNHYIEIGIMDNGRYALSVHTGSRNLGKKTCEYFQNMAIAKRAADKNLIAQKHKFAKTPEEHAAIQKEIENSPKTTNDLCYIEGADVDLYLDCMTKAQAVARMNRILISHDILGYLDATTHDYFDTIHNYIEVLPDCFIIRKGAISAAANKRVAIPLNMRDGVILGVGKGNPDWNESAPHGAGRLYSRGAAKANISLEDFQTAMNGIQTWSVDTTTIDEAPQAYKDASSIISAIGDTVDIVQVVKPVYNFKAS